MKTIKNNVTRILENYLKGKTMLDIYVEDQHPTYGYVDCPKNSLCEILHYDAVIEKVKIDLPEYETGSITVYARPNNEDFLIEINVSSQSFKLMF